LRFGNQELRVDKGIDLTREGLPCFDDVTKSSNQAVTVNWFDAEDELPLELGLGAYRRTGSYD